MRSEKRSIGPEYSRRFVDPILHKFLRWLVFFDLEYTFHYDHYLANGEICST